MSAGLDSEARMFRRAIQVGVLLSVAACGGGEDDKKAGELERGCVQVPTCVGSLQRQVTSICYQDECVPVGSEGRSSVIVHGLIPSQLLESSISSYSVSVFHTDRPAGGRDLTCEDVLALSPEQRRNEGYTNTLSWTSARANLATGDNAITMAALDVPVDAGKRYIVLAELFSGSIDTASRPTGVVLAEGCIEGVEFPIGHYMDHPDDENWAKLVPLERR